MPCPLRRSATCTSRINHDLGGAAILIRCCARPRGSSRSAAPNPQARTNDRMKAGVTWNSPSSAGPWDRNPQTSFARTATTLAVQGGGVDASSTNRPNCRGAPGYRRVP